MKRLSLILTTAALGAALSACGQKTADRAPEAGKPSASAGSMGEMDTGGAKMVRGTGTVTAVDKSAGTITLDHGPIAEVGWPAMTMAFDATPKTLLDTVAVGDRVSFDLKMTNGAGQVTAIQKQ